MRPRDSVSYQGVKQISLSDTFRDTADETELGRYKGTGEQFIVIGNTPNSQYFADTSADGTSVKQTTDEDCCRLLNLVNLRDIYLHPKNRESRSQEKVQRILQDKNRSSKLTLESEINSKDVELQTEHIVGIAVDRKTRENLNFSSDLSDTSEIKEAFFYYRKRLTEQCKEIIQLKEDITELKSQADQTLNDIVTYEEKSRNLVEKILSDNSGSQEESEDTKDSSLKVTEYVYPNHLQIEHFVNLNESSVFVSGEGCFVLGVLDSPATPALNCTFLFHLLPDGNVLLGLVKPPAAYCPQTFITEASESLFKGIDEVEKRKMVKEVILSLVREDDLKGINELEGFLQSAAKDMNPTIYDNEPGSYMLNLLFVWNESHSNVKLFVSPNQDLEELISSLSGLEILCHCSESHVCNALVLHQVYRPSTTVSQPCISDVKDFELSSKRSVYVMQPMGFLPKNEIMKYKFRLFNDACFDVSLTNLYVSSSPREGFLLTQRKNLEEIIYLLLKDLKKKLEEKEEELQNSETISANEATGQSVRCEGCQQITDSLVRTFKGQVYCLPCITHQGFYRRIEGDTVDRRDLEKYICPFCKQFAEDPVTASCTHSYCRACSKEMEKGPTVNETAKMECFLGERCRRKKITRFYESLAIRTQQGHYFYICPVTGESVTLGNIKKHQRDCHCLPDEDE